MAEIGHLPTFNIMDREIVFVSGGMINVSAGITFQGSGSGAIVPVHMHQHAIMLVPRFKPRLSRGYARHVRRLKAKNEARNGHSEQNSERDRNRSS